MASDTSASQLCKNGRKKTRRRWAGRRGAVIGCVHLLHRANARFLCLSAHICGNLPPYEYRIPPHGHIRDFKTRLDGRNPGPQTSPASKQLCFVSAQDSSLVFLVASGSDVARARGDAHMAASSRAAARSRRALVVRRIRITGQEESLWITTWPW
ncbi:hypothetical protein K440DRAFT_636520 [Wilcoxina mikolae CBS 423.85]|nr:hypothetical protein K440DRAFT_636520 [Wilcoxina mikolae CBS 423.85]